MQGGPEVGLAGQTYTVGDNRLAFGVIDAQGAVRLRQDRRLRRPDAGRQGAGPVPGPGRRARDRPALPLPPGGERDRPVRGGLRRRRAFSKPGPWSVLTVTQAGGGMLAAPAQVKVVTPAKDPIPAVGEAAPKVRDRHGRLGQGRRGVDRHADPDRARAAPGVLRRRRRQEARRAAVRHAAAVPVARLRPGDRHRAAAEGQVRRPDDLHPPGGLRRQRPQQGPAQAAAGSSTCARSRGCSSSAPTAR